MTKRVAIALLITVTVVHSDLAASEARCAHVPSFVVDPIWPKPLPDQWLLGQVTAVAIDKKDSVWVLHRPETLSPEEKGAETQSPRGNCCIAAPPVLVFDQSGKMIAAWGGQNRGNLWPHREHSLAIDPRDGSVWIAGNDQQDGFVVKYTSEGEFILKIGTSGSSKGSNDASQLGRPSGLAVEAAANELFIADGYTNHRIIVFDATTGAYKRHWGAYGRPPQDVAPTNPLDQLIQPHGISLSSDGLVYVSDRPNNRIQVFAKNGRFVREYFQKTEIGRTAWDAVTWPLLKPTHILAADGVNNEIRIMDRSTGKVQDRLGRTGPYAGQFRMLHNIAVDRADRIYTVELGEGRRIQRFRPTHKLAPNGRC